MKPKYQDYNSKQCGQACLAMITGQEILEVCIELKKLEDTHIRFQTVCNTVVLVNFMTVETRVDF